MGVTRRELANGRVRYYARYSGPDGKRHESNGSDSKEKARRFADRKAVELELGVGVLPMDGKTKFHDFVETRYWPTTAHLSPTTRAGYRSVIDKHCLPAFGGMALAKITAPVVQTWLNGTVVGGLSPKSASNAHMLLKKIFKVAAQDSLLQGRNPCEFTSLPPLVKREKDALSLDQFEAIYAAMAQQHRLMLAVFLGSGMRWGELIGLRPADVNFGTDEIRLTRVILEVSKKNSPTGERFIEQDRTKERQDRTVKIDPGLIQEIKIHMMARGLRDGDLLFGTNKNTPMSRNTFRTRYWEPARKAAELPVGVTPHALRHTHITWLLDNGASLVVVMRRVGHRQLSTTQGYAHLMPDAGDQALAALSRATDAQRAARADSAHKRPAPRS